MSYGIELWRWKESEKLEKIMMDYVRLFRLDFYTSRYVITREIGVDKLRMGWSIKAKRFEERIRRDEKRILKHAGEKKRKGIEREKYYNRNGWGTIAIERENIGRIKEYREEELITRKRESVRAEEDSRILEARYNKNYIKRF